MNCLFVSTGGFTSQAMIVAKILIIGRGATLDFQMFELNELKEVKNLLNQLINLQIEKLEGKEMA